MVQEMGLLCHICATSAAHSRSGQSRVSRHNDGTNYPEAVLQARRSLFDLSSVIITPRWLHKTGVLGRGIAQVWTVGIRRQAVQPGATNFTTEVSWSESAFLVLKKSSCSFHARLRKFQELGVVAEYGKNLRSRVRVDGRSAVRSADHGLCRCM